MIIAVPKEAVPGELRVALVPAQIPKFSKAGHEVLIEKGAGYLSGYTDEAFQEKGAVLVSRKDLFSKADVIFTVRSGAAGDKMAVQDTQQLREGQIVIGLMDPYQPHDAFRLYKEKK